MKVFLLSTAGHTNKGDHLMVEGVIDFIRNNYKDAKISIPFFSKFPTKKYNIYRVLVAHKYKNTFKHMCLNVFCNFLNSFFKILPKSLRYKFGYICLNEVTCIIDTSGFYLGDQWHVENLYGLANSYKRYKNIGARIILMPKAFGPFSKTDVIKLAKEIYSIADIVFVRDSFSFAEFNKILLNHDKLVQVPDYSGIILPKSVSNKSIYSDKVCIIPNFRFFEKNNLAYSSYLKFVCETINYLKSKGIKSFFVIHSSLMDIDIALHINKLLDNKIDIIQEEDPKLLKGYVGAARFTISSRYHGVINALSQARPAIGTSWNHKYEELFSEYNIDKLLLKEMKIDDMKSAIDYLIDKSNYAHIVNSLIQRNTVVRDKVNNMYKLVEEIINK